MERCYDDYKKMIDEHLLDFLPNIDNKSISLYESMKYSLTAGGKRIRPVLLLAACDFAGGDVRGDVCLGRAGLTPLVGVAVLRHEGAGVGVKGENLRQIGGGGKCNHGKTLLVQYGFYDKRETAKRQRSEP